MQVLTVVLDDAGQEVKLPPPGMFQQWFANAVASTGLTLKDVAEECSVSKQAVSQWINGHTAPNIERQAYLVRFFENLRTKGKRSQVPTPAVTPAPKLRPTAKQSTLDEVDQILLPHAK